MIQNPDLSSAQISEIRGGQSQRGRAPKSGGVLVSGTSKFEILFRIEALITHIAFEKSLCAQIVILGRV